MQYSVVLAGALVIRKANLVRRVAAERNRDNCDLLLAPLARQMGSSITVVKDNLNGNDGFIAELERVAGATERFGRNLGSLIN